MLAPISKELLKAFTGKEEANEKTHKLVISLREKKIHPTYKQLKILFKGGDGFKQQFISA